MLSFIATKGSLSQNKIDLGKNEFNMYKVTGKLQYKCMNKYAYIM